VHILRFITHSQLSRYQLLGLFAQEELAKRQVPAHQVDYGQAYPFVLSAFSGLRAFFMANEGLIMREWIRLVGMGRMRQ